MVTGVGSIGLRPAFGAGALGEIQRTRSTLFQQLATGRRLLGAATDAAGIGIANVLGARIRSLARGVLNVQEGISLAQTAEGGLSQIQANIQRIRELAVQAANDTLATEDRQTIQTEINELTAQISQTANTTQFAGRSLLAGATPNPVLETGEDGTAPPNVPLPTATPAALGLSALDVTTREGALAAIGAAEGALSNISQARGALGAAQRTLQTTAQRLGQTGLELTGALARIQDSNLATATARLTALNVREQAGLAVRSQAGFLRRDGVLNIIVLGGNPNITPSPRSGTFGVTMGSAGPQLVFMPFMTT